VCYGNASNLNGAVVNMMKAGLAGGQGVSFSGDRQSAVDIIRKSGDAGYVDPQTPQQAAVPAQLPHQALSTAPTQSPQIARPTPITNSATPFRASTRDLSIPTAAPTASPAGAGLNIPG
jgi:hypothetical protein